MTLAARNTPQVHCKTKHYPSRVPIAIATVTYSKKHPASEFHHQLWLWPLELLGGLCVTTGPLKVAKFSQGSSLVQL